MENSILNPILNIRRVSSTRNENFEIDQILYTIQFTDILTNFEEAYDKIFEMFQEIVRVFKAKMSKYDKIRIVFFHMNFFMSFYSKSF